MPQMYPLMWLTLFTIFSLLMIIFINKTFFFQNYKNTNPTPTKTSSKNQNKIWLW